MAGWWRRLLRGRSASVHEQIRRAHDQGDLARAVELCLSGLARAPEDAVMRSLYARILAQQGRIAESLDAIQPYADQPGGVEYFIELAESAARSGDARNPVAVLEHAGRLHPGSSRIALRLSDFLIASSEAHRVAKVLQSFSGPEVDHILGKAKLAEGQFESALQLLERSFARVPQAATAFDIAIARMRAGKEVDDWLWRAVELEPRHYEAWLAIGMAALQEGSHATAIEALRRASSLRPELAEAHAQLASALLRAGENEEAMDEAQMALHYDSAFGPAWHYRGLAEQALQQHDDAVLSFQRAESLQPGGAAAAALGVSLYSRGDYETAIAAYRRAQAAGVGDKRLFNNLGLACRETGDFSSALQAFEHALKLDPHYAVAWSNMGLVQQDLGNVEAALGSFSRALELDPSLEEARWYAAVVRLREGDYWEGWKAYESRWQSRTARRIPFRFSAWEGESLAGRHVLIYAEQGLGDQIMFASCVSQMLAQAGKVTLECSRKLESLFRRSFPRATVVGSVTNDQRVPEWVQGLGCVDYQVAIGSLPGHFRHDARQFPVHNGYLRADPGRVEYWRERLRLAGKGPWIGLSWQGGAPGTRRRLRSLPLSALLPLIQGIPANFVSLQYTPCSEEIEVLRREHSVHIHHWPESIEDYDETAALVSALDLVVSVCTSVIHLAGALGRPALVLVPFSAEWRYGRCGKQMPWYPSVELCRQPAPGLWEPVLREATAAALARLDGKDAD